MTTTQIDMLKALVTYLTVALVVIGGLAAIIAYSMDPDKLAIVAGLVGAGLGFLTNGETATRTARAVVSSQSAVTNGHGRSPQETMQGT